MTQIEHSAAGIPGRFARYRACYETHLASVFAGPKLGHMLVLAYMQPRVGRATEFQAGYRVAFRCLTTQPTVGEFRSAFMLGVTRGLSRDRLPAAFGSCLVTKVRAALTIPFLRSFLSLPPAALHDVRRFSNLETATAYLKGVARRDLRARSRALGARLGEQCVAEGA